MFTLRHLTKKSIRNFLDQDGFIELDPPYLIKTNTPDPNIDPLKVVRLKGSTLQLHTSPEIWLKHGLALGLDKLYHFGRAFRDDPPGAYHSLEFTMLEWYRAESNLDDLIMDCVQIFAMTRKAAKSVGLHNDSGDLDFIKTDIDTVFWEYANLNLSLILDRIRDGAPDPLQRELRDKKGEFLPHDASFCDAFFHVMLKYVEPNLPKNQPVVIAKWPEQLAALAAPNTENPNYCDRFEIYFGGLEIANAYQECNDPDIIRTRFQKENCDRLRQGKPEFPIDDEFLASLKRIPKTAGIALGFDRLCLATTNATKISEVILGFIDH